MSKSIYISLYGKRQTSQIIDDIKRKTWPILHTKVSKIGNEMIKRSSKFVSQKSTGGIITIDLDIISIFEDKNLKDITGAKVLVFDDFERSLIPVKEWMGFVNYLVEHCECKVIVIGDDSKLKQEADDDFKKHREKTIGRAFTVKGDEMSALRTFCSELEMDYDKYAALISAVHRMTGYGNLRTLRHCLQDFNLAYKYIEGMYADSDRLDSFYKVLLIHFIISYSHLLANDKIIEDYASYTIFDEAKKQTVIDFNSKYVQGLRTLNCSDLNRMLVGDIIKYYKEGVMPKTYANEYLIDKEKSMTPAVKLFRNLYLLSNEEFDKLVKITRKALDNHAYTSVDGLLYDILAMSYIHSNNLLEDVDNMKSACIAAIDCFFDHAEYDINLKQHVYYCLSGIPGDESKSGFWEEEVRDYFFDKLNKAMTSRRNKLQEFWDKLDSKNVDIYENILTETLPDHSRQYELSAQFEGVDAEVLSERFLHLDNQSLYKMTIILGNLYGVDRIISWHHNFVDDIPVLETIKKKFDNDIPHREKIDRITAETFSAKIGKIIELLKQKANIK